MPAPMSPAEHYLEAEGLLDSAYYTPAGLVPDIITQAQVHAMLATADWETYRRACSVWEVRRERDAAEALQARAEMQARLAEEAEESAGVESPF